MHRVGRLERLVREVQNASKTPFWFADDVLQETTNSAYFEADG